MSDASREKALSVAVDTLAVFESIKNFCSAIVAAAETVEDKNAKFVAIAVAVEAMRDFTFCQYSDESQKELRVAVDKIKDLYLDRPTAKA